jgi:hypothetical protein
MKVLLVAYRLYLMGYRKLESDNEVPSNYSVLKEREDDPYPIAVFGLSKPVSSNKISNYLNSEFYHYLTIYKNIKSFGLPYSSWLESPKWVLALYHAFTDIEAEYSRYKSVKGIL